MSDEQQAPVWARQEAFPAKPTSGAFGFQDVKGKRFKADSLENLSKQIEQSKHGIDLVWTPDAEHFISPEEVLGLRKLLVNRRAHWARNDISDGKRMSLLIGAFLAWSVYAAYMNSRGSWDYIAHSPTVAISAIMLLIFGLVPWYEGWKELRKSGERNAQYWEKEIADARFDSWVNRHLSPFTFLLLGIMLVTGTCQWLSSQSFDWTSGETLKRVGLLKETSPQGDIWWRYLTAPLVHGNLVHWVMNFAGLRYLAKRAEVLARWPHMVMVFLVSAFVGGMATVHFLPSVPSVGASGGILGLLGFLLVFETLHKPLVPKSSRKRLLAGLLMVAVMGLLGFSFIDNAAHAGGLLAGMAYALIVFPKSTSVMRPEILQKDLVAGWVTISILVAATLWTSILLLR